MTPWTASHHASLSSTVSQSWVKLMSIESVMPYNHLILFHPLLLLTSIFSNESALCIRWPKFWSFSFSISPSCEYSVLMSFRTAVQGTLKCLLQHQSLNQESSPGYRILFSYFQHLLQHLTNSWCLINAFRMNAEYSKSTVPNLFSTRDWFHGRQFFHGQGCECDGFGMNQAHYIYCALCFYYYYIRATPQHQALDLEGWGLLTCDRQVSRPNQELEVT